ncbi:MAG: integrin [Steroidobacteraceae bacterium]
MEKLLLRICGLVVELCMLAACNRHHQVQIPSAPAAPTISVDHTANQVVLSWAPVSEADYFVIKKDSTGVSGFSQIGTSLTATYSDHFASLTDWITARYKVAACSRGGCSDSVVVAAYSNQLINYFKASNTGIGDNFGYSVALSADGTTLAVGAYNEGSAASGIDGDQLDNSAPNSGAVYVFTRTGVSWSQQAYLKASNSEASDLFGISLSLSADGSELAVGATGESSGASSVNGNETDNSAPSSGAVYLFARSGTTWTQYAYIKASNAETFDLFGSSVALAGDGKTLAVGALEEDSLATGVNGNQSNGPYGIYVQSGAAYVFVLKNSAWVQEAYIKASNSSGLDYFGNCVALSNDGNTLVVGAEAERSTATGVNGDQSDKSGLGNGAAYVFTRSGTNWTQQAYIKGSNTGPEDYFGFSVSLSADGDTLAIGALGEDSNTSGVNGDQSDDSAEASGAAYVFTRVGNIWTQQSFIKASNPDPYDDFGYTVALSASGNLLVVGSPLESGNSIGVNGNESDNSKSGSGAVYLFTRTNELWAQRAYLKSPNTGVDDIFGFNAALSADGNTLAVGATSEDSSSTGLNGNQADEDAPASGAVFVF